MVEAEKACMEKVESYRSKVQKQADHLFWEMQGVRKEAKLRQEG